MKVYVDINTRTLDKPIYTDNFEFVKYSSITEAEYPCYLIEIKGNKLDINYYEDKDNLTTFSIYLQNINYFINYWTLVARGKQNLKELITCCSLFRSYVQFTIFTNDDLIKSLFIDDHLYDIQSIEEYQDNPPDINKKCLAITRISLNKFNMTLHYNGNLINFQIPYDDFLKIMSNFQDKNGDTEVLKSFLKYTGIGFDYLKLIKLQETDVNQLYIILRLVASRVSNPQKQIINLSD